MNSIWSDSIDKKTSLFYELPNPLKELVGIIYQQRYGELYEVEPQTKIYLQDAIENILNAFISNNPTLTHLRYVWMALIMAIVVEPTVKYYEPDSFITEEITTRLAVWLIETLKRKQISKTNKLKEVDEILNVVHSIPINNKIASFQILCEALNVYKNAIKALDSKQSLEALINILDDCLEGYAIFPGADGRRELFDWWLLDVLPASWCLLAPTSMYLINKVQNDTSVVSDQALKLKKLSAVMWSIILESSEDEKRNNRLGFQNKSNKIVMNSKIGDN